MGAASGSGFVILAQPQFRSPPRRIPAAFTPAPFQIARQANVTKTRQKLTPKPPFRKAGVPPALLPLFSFQISNFKFEIASRLPRHLTIRSRSDRAPPVRLSLPPSPGRSRLQPCH